MNISSQSPNIIFLMVDQLTGTLFDEDGLPKLFLHVPNIRKLAEKSMRFSHGYSPSPLCTPARGCFMNGLLPSQSGIYDNAAEFSSSIPTFAHYLRLAGYQTALVGKMHFVGTDQLHGFETRLTTDIYPADFGWTPDYLDPAKRIDWWYHNMSSVTNAGVAAITNQLEFDDEVAFIAKQKLYDLARGQDSRPFSLTISFTHPHDPYLCRKKYWDLYENCDALLPEIPAMNFNDHDPHSQRILKACDYDKLTITDQDIMRARRAYFGNISYLDEQIGDLLDILENTGQEAMIFLIADHGDMLGEKGLWYKMSFFEGSARIPMMVAGNGITPCTIKTPVSLIDIVPTVLDILGDKAFISDEASIEYKGQSLLKGEARDAPIYFEYMGEASHTPLVALREGRYKYIHCDIDPPQLYDLEQDPHELQNLVGLPAYKTQYLYFKEKIASLWDLKTLHAQILHNQQQRKIIYNALKQGKKQPWDYQPFQETSDRFMRNHMDLNLVEARQFVPDKTIYTKTINC